MRFRQSLIEVFPAVALLSVLPATSTEAGPIFMGLEDLPGGSFMSRATAVSADGTTVVGASRSGFGLEAFVWTVETGMLGLGDLPGGAFMSEAYDVSGNGQVITGFGSSTGLFQSDGFRWESGVMTDLGISQAGWSSSFPSGISRDGSTIVGGGGSPNGFEAFRWTAVAGIVGLGDLPGGDFQSQANAVSSDGLLVAGSSQTDSAEVEAFLWESDSAMVGLGFLPSGNLTSTATAMTGDGATIVGHSYTDVGTQAYRWTKDAGMSPLGQFSPFAVSDDASVIVGGMFVNPRTSFAAIWDEVYGLRNLQEILEIDLGVDLSNWMLESANDISSDGTVIVGTGINPFGQTEAWIAIIPEPTTLVLLAIGAWLIPRRRSRPEA